MLVVLCLSSILLGFGIEFLGILLVVVYVGAIAVLFLFVVMMLNLKVDQTNESLVRYVPLVAIISLFIFFEIQYVYDPIILGSYLEFVSDMEEFSTLLDSLTYTYHPMTHFPLDAAIESPVPTGYGYRWGWLAILLGGEPFFPSMPLMESGDRKSVV